MTSPPSSTSLVLTIIGTDRPGLVDSLAEVVANNGGNWLESRMAHLGGKFAGIVHVEVAGANGEALMAALKQLESEGLQVVSEHDANPPTETGWTLVTLDAVGNDRPGIVRDVTHALAERNVNVEQFETEYTTAPMSGGSIFKATAKLRLPPEVPVTQLRDDLESLAGDIMVDIKIRPMDDDRP